MGPDRACKCAVEYVVEQVYEKLYVLVGPYPDEDA